MVEIISIFAAAISALMALLTFLIYRRNSKPKIKLTILNNDPYFTAGKRYLPRNFFYIDEHQQNALIHIEIENQSSTAGTITDIFIHPENVLLPSQAMASYKDYAVQNFTFVLEDPERTERYRANNQNLRQPITVQPYGYLIGFLFFAKFQTDKNPKFFSNVSKINCVLEYRIAGFDKCYSEKITLYKVSKPLCEETPLPPPRKSQ